MTQTGTAPPVELETSGSPRVVCAALVFQIAVNSWFVNVVWKYTQVGSPREGASLASKRTALVVSCLIVGSDPRGYCLGVSSTECQEFRESQELTIHKNIFFFSCSPSCAPSVHP